MDLLVSDHIGQVHKLRVFADKAKEPEKEIWFPVPQPLEPIQKMLHLPNPHRVLLFRRTGIVQLLDSKTTEVVAAAKMDDFVEGVDCLELWKEGEEVKAFLSNGRIYTITLSEEQISFSLLKTLQVGQDPITASHYSAEGFLTLGSKSLLPTVFSLAKDFSPIFAAKKPKADKLGMHVKADVRSILYLPAENKLVCGLANGQVWIYDTSLEGKSKEYGYPCIQKELYKIPISLLHAFNSESFLAANSRGSCESYSLDRLIRTGGYSGHTGAVAEALYLPESMLGPVIVSSSMDRFITVYEAVSRKPLQKIFLGHVPVSMTVLKLVKEPVKEAADKMWAQLPKVK